MSNSSPSGSSISMSNSTRATTPDDDVKLYRLRNGGEVWHQQGGADVIPASQTTLASIDDKGLPIVYERDNVLGPGLQALDVYESQMGWRASVRKRLVRNLETESRVIAAMQERIRRPFLDSYFVYTSSLGTHTFFMTVLPAFFFFGHDVEGRGLLHVIGVGVYLSSLIKDSFCAPRPFAPPVTRLTIGTHHLEYGFPSTHSTNSVSIALHFYSIALRLYASGTISFGWLRASQVFLFWYAASIVYGRLYCAMHSFTDCTMGVALGTSVWAAQYIWGQALETWMVSASLQVPVFTTLLCLFLVHAHPEPVDDCPCFEDAIAFVSVLAGSTLSRWNHHRMGLDQQSGYFTATMPTESWGAWGMVAGAKMVLGISIIFAWRLIAKSVLHVVLPPIIRFASHLFTLPNRRFYTPATDYETVPPEEDAGPLGLKRPIPSVINLASHMREEGMMYDLPSSRMEGLKMRGGRSPRESVKGLGSGGSHESAAEPVKPKVKHYDADVLTKVIVYIGIAYLATGSIPVLFEKLGWGL